VAVAGGDDRLLEGVGDGGTSGDGKIPVLLTREDEAAHRQPHLFPDWLAGR
jgi:hypothetical protein